MTTADQLNAFLKDVPGFLGVFPSDRLPRLLKSGESLVANYDPQGKGGSHWVSMGRDRLGRPWYFDSYGFKEDDDDRLLGDQTHFARFLQAYGSVKTNRIELQSMAADTCGEWAAWAVLHGMPNRHSAAWRRLIDLPREKADSEIRRLVDIRA